MISAPEPAFERERLQSLGSFSILETLPEQDYDNITALAAQICDTPVSLVTLIDKDRQWFKSHHGVDASETPREYAFCAHAILKPNEIFTIADAREDERFKDNPLVTGDPYVIFYTGVPLVTEDGLPLGTLCVIDNKPKELNDRQLSSLKILSDQVINLLHLRRTKLKLEKAVRILEQKNHDLEQFTYIASHDLKEPLGTIGNFSSLLLMNYGDQFDEKAQKSLNFITGAVKRMTSLISGLLEYSVIGRDAEGKKVDCNLLVNQVVTDLTNVIEDNSAQIEVAELPVVWAFETELRLLFQNLISNAIKFSANSQPPKVHLSANENKNEWVFSVTDNGIGIQENQLKKIFFIFQRLHTRQEYTGSGIGLAHCKKIVELHHGNIWVESKPGEGSTFYFSIPKK